MSDLTVDEYDTVIKILYRELSIMKNSLLNMPYLIDKNISYKYLEDLRDKLVEIRDKENSNTEVN